MSWKKSGFASSLLSLFGESASDDVHGRRMEAIRQAMLDCLVGVGQQEELARVAGRVLWTRDIQSLWYLRSDVMTVLCRYIGECAARERIQTVTDMFHGLLPAAQKARLIRLGR